MCRCADRRGAIIRGAAALARGDVATVKAEAAFVAASTAQDANVARKAALAAAHARLKRR